MMAVRLPTRRSNEAAMSLVGTSRHFAATQQFGRFLKEADIEPL
jgi:hypothetical protein